MKERTDISGVITFLVASREGITDDQLAAATYGQKARKSAVARIKKECNALARAGFIERDTKVQPSVNWPGHKTLCFLALRGGYVEAVAESPDLSDFRTAEVRPNAND